jgi:tRNA nucleotidyltransferase (CCA-adding enzyme)
MDDAQLRDKLRKIEALFAGAGTPGEQRAAAAALERIRERLAQVQRQERPIEIRFTFPDQWARRLFVALCRRYALHPYRYRRQRHTTVMLRAPESFVNGVLWPEFQQLHQALVEYLSSATERIIRDEVHRDTAEAEEVDEPPQLG